MKPSKKLIGILSITVVMVVLIAVLMMQIKNAGKISETELIKPKVVTMDHSINKTTADQMVRAARLFYTFWNTGDAKFLDAVIAPTFVDHTLPKGRAQGPDGIRSASDQLRTAIIDLQCSIEELLVVGDKMTARLLFHGTSTGSLMGHPATGKPIAFVAIDVLHVQDSKIVEDWHLEDNRSLYEQLGVVNPIK